MRPEPLSLMGLADWLPFALSHLKCCGQSGFCQPRSYLFCHHCVIARAIGGVFSCAAVLASNSADHAAMRVGT